MTISNNIAYPTPVLRAESNDYLHSQFTSAVIASVTPDDKINIAIDFDQTSPEIATQLASGHAVYVAVASCRDTVFEKVITPDSADLKNASTTISRWDVDNVLSVATYIVARQHITQFLPNDLHLEFGQQPVDFQPGSFLATGEVFSYCIYQEVFKSMVSVIDLVMNKNLQEGEWQVDLESDKICIEVDKKMKVTIDKECSSQKNQTILMNGLYLPALIHVIQQLQNKKDDYSERRWAKVIETKALSLAGDDWEKDDAYKVVNKLLGYPLNNLKSRVFEENDG